MILYFPPNGTEDDLLEKFRENAGKNLDNDRILLSKVEK